MPGRPWVLPAPLPSPPTVTSGANTGAHLAVWDAAGCTQYNLNLSKGLRDRDGEEELVSRLLVQALARASGVDSELPLEVLDLVEVTRQDSLEILRAEHPDPVDLLLSGDVDCVLVYADGTMVIDEPWEGAVLPGSFRPYHQGHENLAKVAEQILDRPVLFELSVSKRGQTATGRR